jgi:hypothetical protein
MRDDYRTNFPLLIEEGWRRQPPGWWAGPGKIDYAFHFVPASYKNDCVIAPPCRPE